MLSRSWPPGSLATSAPPSANWMDCRTYLCWDAPGQEERVWGDKESVGLLTHERCKGRIDLPNGAGIVDLDLHPKSASGRFHICERGRTRCVGRIDEHGHPHGCRNQLT